MGVKYVDDFEFPASAGFSGSTGQVQSVKGYNRQRYAKGGRVKKQRLKEMAKDVPNPRLPDKEVKKAIDQAGDKAKVKKAVGGPVHAKKGGYNRTPLVGKKY